MERSLDVLQELRGCEKFELASDLGVADKDSGEESKTCVRDVRHLYDNLFVLYGRFLYCWSFA
jgi:hypothetical protein